jgi:hypothetical protein
MSQARNQHKAGIERSLIHAGFLLGLFLDPEDGKDVSPKRWSISNILYSDIPQEKGLFIPTAVKTSDPT